MKERASSLFQDVRVAYAKADHIQQNIQKELITLKEQQTFWREIDANLVEIKGMDNNIVKSLKLITSGEEEKIDISLENIIWKNDSMNQQLGEGEQFLNSCKLLKKKALGNILMIVEGIPSSEHTQDPNYLPFWNAQRQKLARNLVVNKIQMLAL